jgi:hypothetical protein
MTLDQELVQVEQNVYRPIHVAQDEIVKVVRGRLGPYDPGWRDVHSEGENRLIGQALERDLRSNLLAGGQQ